MYNIHRDRKKSPNAQDMDRVGDLKIFGLESRYGQRTLHLKIYGKLKVYIGVNFLFIIMFMLLS